MNERIGCNTIIKNDLTSVGFDVRWNLNGGLIVSLNRRLFTSEVRDALFEAGYVDGMFTANQNSHYVIVNAVTG